MNVNLDYPQTSYTSAYFKKAKHYSVKVRIMYYFNNLDQLNPNTTK